MRDDELVFGASERAAAARERARLLKLAAEMAVAEEDASNWRQPKLAAELRDHSIAGKALREFIRRAEEGT